MLVGFARATSQLLAPSGRPASRVRFRAYQFRPHAGSRHHSGGDNSTPLTPLLACPPRQLPELVADLPALLKRDPRTEASTPAADVQPHRRLEPHEIEQLVAAYESGEDLRAVGARLGIRRQTAARLLKEASVRIRRQGLDSEQLAEAVRFYGEGWSCQRLGERFSVDHGTVWRALKLADVVLRKPWER